MNVGESEAIAFSVVIPAYNREKTIKRAIDSVLRQTYQNFEIIVVDDGSTDGTKDVVLSIHDDRIRYIYQENQGAQVARNHGLHLANGDYISFLDSDDEWLPGFLETVRDKFFDDISLGCVYCLTGITDITGHIRLAREDRLEGNIYAEALQQGYITSPSALSMKRSCFDEIGEWDVDFKACQDDDICFRLAKKYKFALIPEILALVHISYDGCGDRISTSLRRVADAWWQLWRKYETDVVEYCGKHTMANHYLECADRFAQLGDKTMMNMAYLCALSFYDYPAAWQDFLARLPARNIYCYGAGEYAKVIGSKLLEMGMVISAFFVSDGQGKAENLFGVPVYYISSFPRSEAVPVILTTSKKYHKELRKILQKHQIDEIYSVDDDMYLWLKTKSVCAD